jgi:hypothetical protein
MSADGETPGPMPAAIRQEVKIRTHIVQDSLETTAERAPDGNYEITYVVLEGGEPIRRTLRCGNKGKMAILDALAGGLHLPTP